MFNWNEREILRYLGHRGQVVPENVGQLMIECRQELEREAVPKSIWRSYPLQIAETAIDASCFQTNSRNLARTLQDCDEILLFGATLGTQVDVLLMKYGKLRVSKAVVMQAAAVTMLETYCDERTEELKAEYLLKKRYLRPRFSPGYGDFSLVCQQPIAAALELSKRIGITLTESMLMVPSKSVTAVMGVSRIPGNCQIRGCEACARRDCPYRR